jgi:hypothetical protein
MHEVKKQGWQIRLAACFVAIFLPMKECPFYERLRLGKSNLSAHMKQLQVFAQSSKSRLKTAPAIHNSAMGQYFFYVLTRRSAASG